MVSKLSFKQGVVFFCVFCFSLGIIGFFSYGIYSRQEKTYYIYFDCSVNGLKEGSPVTYKGVEIGLVSEISIDLSNIDLVRVSIKIQQNFPVYSNYTASLSYKGMSGYYTIDLNKESSIIEKIKMPPGSCIVYKATNLDAVLQNIPEVVQETKVLLKKINSSFTEQQIKNISVSLEQLALNLKECSEDFRIISKHSKKESVLLFKRLDKNLKTFTRITKKMEKDYSKIQIEVINRFCKIISVFENLSTKVSDRANTKTGFWKFFC